MKIKVLIVDPEYFSRQRLRTLLEEYPDFSVISECGDSHSAISLLSNQKVDLIFTEIFLPEINAFEMIKRIGPEKMPAIVFVTTMKQYATHAFKANALAYLLKPYDKERFKQIIKVVRNRFIPESGAPEKNLPRNPVSKDTYSNQIFRFTIKTPGNVTVIALDEINWIEGLDDSVRLHTVDGDFRYPECLPQVFEKLKRDIFLQVKDNKIINLDNMREIVLDPAEAPKVLFKSGASITIREDEIDGLVSKLSGLFK